MKPENIMYGLGDDKNVYLIDYGLTGGYIKDGKHIEKIRTGRILGTPRYVGIVNIHRGYIPSREMI